MEESQIYEATTALSKVFKERFGSPFPYEDCRVLLSIEEHQDLIPDLDTYFYNIASHCEGIKRVLGWPSGKLEEAKRSLSTTFFERYPQYKQLEQHISEVDTPRLYARMKVCEELRLRLLQVISTLLSSLQLEA